jgi:prepilin-type N-terminal cleavage/methylation domain-containing protein
LIESFITTVHPSKKSFTLVELIIVVIIVGILASLGLTQYSLMVEKSRLAEAKVRIGVMRQLAHEYYLNNGDMSSITNADLGVDGTCSSTGFYNFWCTYKTSTLVQLASGRCTGGGKNPNATRQYYFYMNYVPSTGYVKWYCEYVNDVSPCFGFESPGSLIAGP